MKKLVNSFCLVFSAFVSTAQMDAKFIDHLALNNLREEHKAYLETFSASDSCYYYKARYHLKYQNDTAFLNNFFKGKTETLKDSAFLKEASIYFLSRNNAASATWFNDLPGNTPYTYNIQLAYQAGLNPNSFSSENFPFELQKPFRLYKKSYRKKPIVAAALSFILPGAGKLYAGKTKTFILTFMINAAYAIQTAESIQKLGIKNPFTIINATGFGIFYLSNVYGSYKAVTELRKERKKQFLTDAANFYN